LLAYNVTSIVNWIEAIFHVQFLSSNVYFVSYLPSCPKVAAISFARTIGKDCTDVFYKIRSERSFQGSNMADRASSIEKNLVLFPGMRERIRGKRVVVIEDSLVRGNNSPQAWKLLKEAGVAKAILLSYTPPIGIIGSDGVPRGCMFGVDMPSVENENHKFVARDGMRNRTIDEISKIIGMRVMYLSVEGMLEVFEELGRREVSQ